MQTSTWIPDARPLVAVCAGRWTICLIVLLAPLLASAQPDGRAPPASQSATTAQPAVREVSLADVSDRLGLNPVQQNLWDVFRSKVDAYTAGYYRQQLILPSPEEATTRQIERLVDQLQNRLAALEDVETAAKYLYPSLTPAQQKIANEWLLLAIPTFSSSSSTPTRSAADACGPGSRPEAGKGPRYGGAGGPMAN